MRRSLVFVVLFAVCLAGCASAPSRRGPGDVLDDAKIHAVAKARLIDDPRVDADEVNLEVREGVVTLLGWVSDQTEKRTIEQLVWSVNGVKQVRNELRIRGTESAP